MVRLEVGEHCSSLVVPSMLEASRLTGQDLEPEFEQDLVVEEQNPFALSSLVVALYPKKPHRRFEAVGRYFAGAECKD